MEKWRLPLKKQSQAPESSHPVRARCWRACECAAFGLLLGVCAVLTLLQLGVVHHHAVWQPATPAPAPKVALLFMTQGTIANEAVWRAFFKAASQLQLHPSLRGAAAAAAQRTAATSIEDAIGQGKALHPDAGSFPAWVYPGYRVQHGLAEDIVYTPTWEAGQQLLQSAKMAGQQRQPAQAEPLSLRQQQQQEQQQEQPWNAYSQVSTLREALAFAGWPPQPKAATAASLLNSISRKHLPALQAQVDAARCAALLGATGPVQPLRQPPLFSVYVHTPAGVLLPDDSLFSGCELVPRVNTTRGYAQHVLAEAASLLLWAALTDPLNAKFVLVSDTSVPLYPPQVIWSQLMWEPLSRLDACIGRNSYTQTSRWHPFLATPYFQQQHWRKTLQWFALSRAHAMLAVADTHVKEMFHRYCYTFWPADPGHDCVSDEHWLPSLLASYGLDHQTDCEGVAHYVYWVQPGGWHPKTFAAAELTPKLLDIMRMGNESKGNATRAIVTASAILAPTLEHHAHRQLGRHRRIAPASLSSALAAAGYAPLPSSCSLLARKFAEDLPNETFWQWL